MTMKEWFPLWLAAYKKGTIRDSSYHQLELLGRLIPDSVKNCPMDDIRPIELQAFFNTFAKTASKSYVDKMRVLLNALFDVAIDNDFCSKNPMKKVRVPHMTEPQRESYSFDDVKAILRYAMDYPNRRIAVRLLHCLFSLAVMYAQFRRYWATRTSKLLPDICTQICVRCSR